ncbi:Aste57867_23353 [Aphanomyces stellatus]|uniref:Aste57867_23353 protein n=1 Tax=Aphanomyces stellatus TaxID=120398 RepID=A0A485LMJ5_9STRA|nr:hypothetical protein As57867_023282 [Aphanomyces stellatus]VFT99998.1 Aste57867_23353 [Aphanomyces stellatus]
MSSGCPPCDGCGLWNPPTFARCFHCQKTSSLDDKTKVKLLYEQVLAFQSKYAEIQDISHDTKVEDEILRLRLDLQAKDEQREAIEMELHAAKKDNERHVGEMEAAQRAREALERALHEAKEAHERELSNAQRVWAATAAAARHQYEKDVCELTDRIDCLVKGRHDKDTKLAPDTNQAGHGGAKAAVGQEGDRRHSMAADKKTTTRQQRKSTFAKLHAQFDGVKDEPGHNKGGARPTAPTPVSPLPLPLASDGKFKWSDGHLHRAPERWRCPEATCKTLWCYWFRGDVVNQIGPFQFLKASDVDHIDSRNLLARGRAVMEQLIKIAMAGLNVPSIEHIASTHSSEFMAIFDRSFDILVGKTRDGNLTHDGFETINPDQVAYYTYATVYEIMMKANKKRKCRAS